MNLQCLKDIITNNLAIHIDLTNLNSWDLNTGYTITSLTKWKDAYSDNLNLIDFGLTGFDNGRTNKMWSGITLTSKDVFLNLYRVGSNNVQNPTPHQTSGMTITTEYDNYQITGITTGETGNFFLLNGGWLQGFYKLYDYNYELLPSRFNHGITIETLLYLLPESNGIFYSMGIRAEDKYSPSFSGETNLDLDNASADGVVTSEENYLDSVIEKESLKSAFIDFNDRMKTEYIEKENLEDIKNNLIAFEITPDKKIAYKYINDKGLIITNFSDNQITTTGLTLISITFTPETTIDDPDILECAERRFGDLCFYLNGKLFWIIKEFPEFYFHNINNDKEKQIGVPYSIGWGGGSFGLRHSWHYDLQKYILYKEQNTEYINNSFIVQKNPLIDDECSIESINDNELIDGLSLSADTTTFKQINECNPDVSEPITVMRIEYTGTTATTNNYFIKYNHPISVLSNRDYEIDLSMFNDGFFKDYDDNGNRVYNKISILLYGTVDIDIITSTDYEYPVVRKDYKKASKFQTYPIADGQTYQYMKDGVLYYGKSGEPVYTAEDYYTYFGLEPKYSNIVTDYVLTGKNIWLPLKTKFRTQENTGQQYIYVGILIETTDTPELNKPLFISDFTYTGADILVQEERKRNLLIENNFSNSFIGGVQKLRIYDVSLTTTEIMHNAMMENKKNQNIVVTKGGRIIYK